MELFCYSLIFGLIVLIFLQEDEVEAPVVDIRPPKKKIPSIHPNDLPWKKPILQDWRKKKKYYQETLASFTGERIIEVYYVLVNYPQNPFSEESYHHCDKGVLIKFSGGKWLNWIWVENGIHDTPEIRLSFMDERETLQDRFTTIKKVSNTDMWREVWAKHIEQITCEFEELDKNQEYLSKLSLRFGGFDIKICSTEEPDPVYFTNLDAVRFAPEWTLIYKQRTST